MSGAVKALTGGAALALLALPRPAAAAVDSGDTAWILVATALVLFMTLPGLALFYGGLVRSKNVLSVLMQCLVLASMLSVLWLVAGYSLSFSSGPGALDALVGGLGKAFLNGVSPASVEGTIPESLFFAFQMTFAVITPALIVGAFVERMRFAAVLAFSALWLVVVYAPICHMVWGGGLFAQWGVFDFAGGIVVHITAGVAALVTCIVVGTRSGYPRVAMPPHNLTLTFAGTAMLWVGWFGFNAGSALGANGDAAMALVVTHISASTATLTWMSIEWIRHGKPSLLGAATGAIAGLAAVTPASGFIGPLGGLAIGLASGAICWWASTVLKFRLGYDDSLDVFGVHGVGGFVGTVLAGVFAASALGGNQAGLAIGPQVGLQLGAALLAAAYTALATWVILKLVGSFTALRIDEAGESQGLDLAEHDEAGYTLGDFMPGVRARGE